MKMTPQIETFFKRHLILLFSFFVFLTLLPIASSITFMQNDDWIWYQQIEGFLNGNFTLHPLAAPTFYLQGIIATLFAQIFSLSSLPILTLLFGTASFTIFCLLLRKKFDLRQYEVIGISLLLLLSPVVMYSLWGFMTDVYYLFFYILALYASERVLATTSRKNLAALAATVILAFFVRQAAVTIPVAFTLYFLIKKEFLRFTIAMVFSLSILGYYFFLFPQTPEMLSDKSLMLENALNIRYMFSVTYAVCLLLASSIIPLTIPTITKLWNNKRNLAAILTSMGILSLLHHTLFDPHFFEYLRFPYLGNTFGESGFLPSGIGGTKHHFPGYLVFFKVWFGLSFVSLSILITTIVKNFSKNVFYLVLLATNIGLLIVSPVVYDRYLIPLIPIILIIALKSVERSFITKLFLTAYLFFLILFNYQYSMDFVSTHQMVWDRSKSLAHEKGIPYSEVSGSSAWQKNYSNKLEHERYLLNYDGTTAVHEDIDPNLQLEDKFQLHFPFSIYISPVIHVWERP